MTFQTFMEGERPSRLFGFRDQAWSIGGFDFTGGNMEVEICSSKQILWRKLRAKYCGL